MLVPAQGTYWHDLLPSLLSRTSFGAVTSGTIARRGIVLHSGHEEDCRGRPVVGVRPSGVCLEAEILATASESPESPASGTYAESSSIPSCASQAAPG